MSVELHRLKPYKSVPDPVYRFYLWSKGGKSPISEFIRTFDVEEKKKFLNLVYMVELTGLPKSDLRYKKLKGWDNLHEFKLHRVRLFFFIDGDMIVLTEGYDKKKDETNLNVLKRADDRRRICLFEGTVII